MDSVESEGMQIRTNQRRVQQLQQDCHVLLPGAALHEAEHLLSHHHFRTELCRAALQCVPWPHQLKNLQEGIDDELVRTLPQQTRQEDPEKCRVENGGQNRSF